MSAPKPIRLDTLAGWHIDHAIAEAIAKARAAKRPVVFNFNEVKITVEGSSSPGLIYRDWSRAVSGFVQGNKVGPHPGELDAETLAKDAQIQAETERKRAKRDTERQRQEVIEKAELAAALADTPAFGLIDPQGWTKGLSANPDGYGRAIFDFAETWGRLMQAEIAKGGNLVNIADPCCSLANKGYGITGFMYGVAVSILSQAWIHGAELKRWHNAKYGRPDADGTVNPALLTISPQTT